MNDLHGIIFAYKQSPDLRELVQQQRRLAPQALQMEDFPPVEVEVHPRGQRQRQGAQQAAVARRLHRQSV